MKPLFLDTSWVVALLSPRDQSHQRARTLHQQLAGSGRRLTHRGVLFEIGNAFSKQNLRAVGVNYLRMLEADPLTEIVEITPDLYAAGFALFAARPDKDWGLVDCLSFALMTARGLTDALTADDHFAQAGFAARLLG